jgi:hypothetical protein
MFLWTLHRKLWVPVALKTRELVPELWSGISVTPAAAGFANSTLWMTFESFCQFTVAPEFTVQVGGELAGVV